MGGVWASPTLWTVEAGADLALRSPHSSPALCEHPLILLFSKENLLFWVLQFYENLTKAQVPLRQDADHFGGASCKGLAFSKLRGRPPSLVPSPLQSPYHTTGRCKVTLDVETPHFSPGHYVPGGVPWKPQLSMPVAGPCSPLSRYLCCIRDPSFCINLGFIMIAMTIINLFGINVDEICTVLSGEIRLPISIS